MGVGREMFAARLYGSAQECLRYEDRELQNAALRTLTLEDLEERTLLSLARAGKWGVSDDEFQYARLYELLTWFKNSFKWVNAPDCEKCSNKTYRFGDGRPSPEEARWLADRVELYQCSVCRHVNRFPRYNHPGKLLETRRGRCGEWANCFTLYCRALGYRARLVLSFIDHVWTECNIGGRWVHADPCDRVLDKPLLYEKGWKKKLDYVIALSHNGVHDVTKRYTRNWPDVLTRRTLTSEEDAEEVILLLRMQMREAVSSSEWDELQAMDELEAQEIEAAYEAGDPSEGEPNATPLPGRESGSEEWRIVRGEIGDPQSTRTQTSSARQCPERECVDEHVRDVREAVGCVWVDVKEADKAIFKIVSSLKVLHAFLMKFKSQPFRKRGLGVDRNSAEDEFFHKCSLRTKTILFGALCVKADMRGEKEGEEERLWFSEDAVNPVRTALALPVAIELLERLTMDIPPIVTEKWLVNGSRLCSGVACASGELLPPGLASAAFDGLHSTKWEEPDGAEGAWIVYRLKAGSEKQKLAAYEITSANDVPTRDPRKWVLEGSDDGGKTWKTLDSRQGEMFRQRFLSKTYEIPEQNRVPCDIFRLQASSLLRPPLPPMLQIGCIDLLTSKN